MESEDLLTKLMRDVMLDIIAALYANGIRQVHMGGMMRLVGVPDSVASEYDQEHMMITDEFVHLIERTGKTITKTLPEGVTIH
jgi:hypothetical protein